MASLQARSQRPRKSSRSCADRANIRDGAAALKFTAKVLLSVNLVNLRRAPLYARPAERGLLGRKQPRNGLNSSEMTAKSPPSDSVKSLINRALLSGRGLGKGG
jgi:hypothetical protein